MLTVLSISLTHVHSFHKTFYKELSHTQSEVFVGTVRNENIFIAFP